MADAAVEFLLLNLKQLLVYNTDLISGIKEQVESLYNELSMLKAFLKDSTEKRSEYEVVKELVRQIRDVVYEAEDVIDTFVVHTALHRARSTLSKVIHGIDYYLANLRSVGKEIQSIRKKVDEIYRKQSFGFGVMQQRGDTSMRRSPEKKAPVVEEENVVGFDKEAETLIGRLNGGKRELEVVSVIGMGGLGKTTLARKVFTDPTIEYEFYIRSWIYVSQEYTRKEVFLGILGSLDKLTDEMFRWSDERLAEVLRGHLQSGRYLIVIDDVWTREAWNDLKMAFPKNNNRSRILLTSRNKEVATHANPDSSPHHLRFLTDDESWELLEKKVFRKGNCPPEMQDLGKKIAKECGGLPLAIVVIAGLLMKRDKTCDWWEKVAESVGSYVARDPKQCMDILALSYRHLPYHLKACFLYFGAFPEDYEIPVWKLIQLWVAEGFIQQVGEISLEDTAEEQLEDLVDRNLVLVEKRRSNGGIKTCRIHDMLHDLCLREAEEEKFLQEIKGFVQVSCSSLTPTLNKYRRLCIQSRVLDYISSKPSGPHVRSFLCFAGEQRDLGREHTSFIHESFKLLRVMDIRPISLPLFPVKIKELVHLRYVALYGSFEILPASISELWNLQTIIIETSSRTLKVEADIWKMLQLRHLFTNASSRLRGPPAKARKGGKDPLVRINLQTISTISPESCTEDILARTPNLRKLGIRGKLAALMMEDKVGSSLFDNLTKLDHVVTLKLLNDTFPNPPSRGSLPQLYKFPPNLKKLTLADTLLDWDHMSTLGILPKLEVLKLKDNAFKGKRWDSLDGGFRLLRFLQIGKTDLVHWEASSHHFPRLQRLILKHCESLDAVPFGLGDVSTLQSLELYHASPASVASAKQIQKQLQQDLAINRLKLFIYPPEL